MGSLAPDDKTLIVPTEHFDSAEHRRLLANAINAVITGGTHPLRWEDGLGALTAAKVAGANQPTWGAFQDGIFAYEFHASIMNELWSTLHIPHDYAPNTKVYPHIHWSAGGTDTGTCRWGIEYMAAKGHDQDNWPSSTTVYVEQAGAGTLYRHMIAEVSDDDAIPATHLEIDSIVLVRLFRDAAHANDTLSDVACAFFIDLHYQKDRVNGSVNKTPNFYE